MNRISGDSKVRIAVVGAGYWGPNLIRNVARLPQASLDCVCDQRPSRLERIRAQYPVRTVTTELNEVLADSAVDAVILATPPETHGEIGLEILESGRHLLVEKPMAMTAAEAERLVEEAAARELVLLVGHTFEFNAAVLKVRKLIAAGEIGDVYYLHSQRVNLGKVRTNCNALWSLAPHDVSIANFLFGERPLWVRASGYKFLDQELEDVVFLNLGYPQNRVAHIHVSWLDPDKVRRTTVVGSRKMIVYDDMSHDAKVKVFDKGVSKQAVTTEALEAPPFGEFVFLTHTGDVWIPKIDFAEPLHQEVAHFVACIQGREKPRTGGLNGLAVVRALEGAQESLARGGATVEL
ncbi:MAG: Gfo/Idh/MocA family oxidoreductase [bacterium]|nr:Gfo/Idh/MocA family oxidoreductase [bacterium]